MNTQILLVQYYTQRYKWYEGPKNIWRIAPSNKKRTARYVRDRYSVFSCLVVKQSQKHSTQQQQPICSTRATLDSSSTRTSVVSVVVLLRTARAALERTSMMSRFPSIAYCTAQKKDARPRSLDCSSATSTRDKHEHGVAKQSRAHEHSAAAVAPSGTRAILGSSSTRTPVVAVVVRLRTARAAFDRTSIYTFPSMASIVPRKKKETGPRSLDCSSATSTRQTQTRRDQVITGTRALSSSCCSSSSGSTQRHSSNTPLEQHSYTCCCCCFTAV